MPDIAKAKRNVARMIDGGASEAEIDQYLSSEGLSAEALRGGSTRSLGSDMKGALLKLGRDFGGSIPFVDKPGQYKSNPLALPEDIGAVVSAAARPLVKPVSDALYDVGIKPSVGEGFGTGFRYRQLDRDEAADDLTNTALTAVSMIAPARGGARTPPVRPPSLRTQRTRALQDAGVPLTPGQLYGGVAKRAEDAFATTSGSIQRAQTRANEALNNAVINDALSPIGGAARGAGRDAIEAMHTQIGDALDTSFGNANFAADAQLQGDIQRAARGLLPSSRPEAMDLTREFITDASSPGGLSEAFANLNKMKVQASTRGDASLAEFISDFQQGILANLDRTGTGGEAAAIRNARDAFRRSIVPERAAAMTGAREGVFNPDQLFSAVRASDRTVRKNAFAQGNAQYQPLAEAARDVMGGTIGSSGTAERLSLSDPVRFVTMTARNLALRGIYNRPVIGLLNQISRAQTPQALQGSMNALRSLAQTDSSARAALQALSGSSAIQGVSPPMLSSAAAEEQTQPKPPTR